MDLVVSKFSENDQFMSITQWIYSNPKWIVNGEIISVAGVGIFAFGIGISLQRPRS
jgi:predicted negative regulator of RcsB-dependent stress response